MSPPPHPGAKQLKYALDTYAVDSDRRFPPDLETLQTKGYIPVLADLAYREFKSKTSHDWIYYPGFAHSDPLDTIVLAAPMTMDTGQGPRRIIVHLDASVLPIPEAEFQQRIRDQGPVEQPQPTQRGGGRPDRFVSLLRFSSQIPLVPTVKATVVLTAAALGAAAVTLIDNREKQPDHPMPQPPPASQSAVAKRTDPKRASVAAATLKPQLTRELAAVGLKFGDPVFIRIFKEERLLELWIQQPRKATFQLFRTYPVAAMSGKPGPKLKEGDRQAPEGFYFVPRGRMHPTSKFHLAFNLGYPNAYDRAHQRTGSALMVHGDRVSIGCYAMTDAKIEEIYTLCDAALQHGQPFFRVHCFPFRMTNQRMADANNNRWHKFWQNLKAGHDLFEQSRVPPAVSVRDRRYRFD